MDTLKKLLLTFTALLVASSVFIAIGTVHGDKNADIPVDAPTQPIWTGSPAATTENNVTLPTVSAITTVPSLPAETSAAPVTAAPTQNQTPSAPDVNSMSKAQIVQTLGDAVNKTKGYTDAVSVHRTDKFDAVVSKCTGGSMVANIANQVVGGVLKPADETLNFSGGKAVNSEGESMSILMPQNGAFTLTESGVASANISKNGNNTVIELKLIPETVGIGQAPASNAAAIGYLDIGSLDLSMLQLSSATVSYSGSGIKAVINANGYIQSVTYTTPVNVDATAKIGLINGNAVIDATETETWEFNW